MFNVSALLLDNALLKCVVTESSGFQLLLLRVDISQGSVATHSRSRRIFSDSIITNVFVNLTVK